MKSFIKKHYKGIIAFILTIVIGVSSVVAISERWIVADAIFDTSTGVEYRVFKTRTTVDKSVLFIGTYIIHKDAMNDVLYEKAMDSASESGQDIIYYKSELSDGQWYATEDVDNGVKGIASEGKPVDA